MHPTEKTFLAGLVSQTFILIKKQTVGALPDFYMIFREAKGE